MNKFTLIIFSIITVTHTEATTKKTTEFDLQVYVKDDKPNCGEDEILVDCAQDCPSDYCPKHANEDQTCSFSKKCSPACKCRFNYRRATNGSCIPAKDCPPFDCSAKPYQEYHPCPPLGPNGICDQVTPDGRCLLPGHHGFDHNCKPQCRCIDNYFRNYAGDCVPYLEYPGMCPENEKYSKCIEKSGSQSYYSQEVEPYSEDKKSCTAGCVCVEGYIRAVNGICVPEDALVIPLNEATTKKTTEYYRQVYVKDAGVCPKNEVYSNCTQTVCNQDCSAAGKTIHCPFVKVEDCEPGCLCKPNYYRLNGICVPHEQCKYSKPPLVCQSNEEVRCVKKCPPEPTCRTRGILYSCQDDPHPCEEKCVCKENYYRNAIGQCVSNEECDKCLGDHEFYSCGQECDNECKTLGYQNRTNCPIINIRCNEKCYCEDGYARDNRGKCIPVEQCPKSPTQWCGPNEEYTCRTTCPPETCFSLIAKFKCNYAEVCTYGCHCKSGYLRQTKNSPCIPICQCDEMKNSPDCQKSKFKYF